MSRGSEADGGQPGIDERVVCIFLAEQREAGSNDNLDCGRNAAYVQFVSPSIHHYSLAKGECG